nr:DUF3325 family protein [Sphingomonas sp. BT553]
MLPAIVGAAMIALVRRAHWTAVTGSPMPNGSRRRKVTVGAGLLLVTVVFAVLRDGWGMGLLLGPLLIATGIAIVIVTLALRPRALLPVATIVDRAARQRFLLGNPIWHQQHPTDDIDQ